MPKKTYQVLFFDLDGTLLDFDASEKEALSRLLADKGIEARESDIKCYHEINDAMWKMLERGEITREELQMERFVRFFDTLGISELDGNEALHYRTYLSQSAILVSGARELLEDLRERYPLYIVSNGNVDVQYGRLKKAGFQELFQGIFLSQEVGYNKPDKRFFDVCMQNLAGVTANDILLIGDSMSSDMKGGFLSGIDTCWYHPSDTSDETNILNVTDASNKTDALNITDKSNMTDVSDDTSNITDTSDVPEERVPVTYEISRLEELYDILGVERRKTR